MPATTAAILPPTATMLAAPLKVEGWGEAVADVVVTPVAVTTGVVELPAGKGAVVIGVEGFGGGVVEPVEVGGGASGMEKVEVVEVVEDVEEVEDVEDVEELEVEEATAVLTRPLEPEQG